jgi:hypothetical protein
MPTQGERKTKNGVTGEWDGQTWRRVDDEGGSLSQAVQGKGPTASGFGNKGVDDILAGAKDTLASTKRFGQSVGSHPEEPVAAPEDSDPEAFKMEAGEPYGVSSARYAGNLLKGGVNIGKIWNSLKGGVTGPLGAIAEGDREAFAPSQGQESIASPANLARYAKSMPDEIKRGGNALLDFFGHPQDVGAGMTAAVLTDKLPGMVAEGAPAVPGLLRRGAGALGEGLEAAGTKLSKNAVGKYGPGAVLLHPTPAGAAASLGAITVPPSLKAIGRALQRLGPEEVAASAADGIVPGTLSKVERAGLIKQGYSADVIDTIEKANQAQYAPQAAAKATAPSAPATQPQAAAPAPRVRQSTEIPYRSGTPTGVEGLNSPYQPPGAPSLTGIRNAIEGPKTFADTVRAAARDIRPNMIPEQGAQSFADAVRAKANDIRPNLTDEATVPSFADAVRAEADRATRQTTPAAIARPSVEEALATFKGDNPSPYETGVGAKESLPPTTPQDQARWNALRGKTRPGNIPGVNLGTNSAENLDDLAHAMKTVDFQLGYDVPDQVDLTAATEYHSPLDAASRLAKLSRARQNSGAGYAE